MAQPLQPRVLTKQQLNPEWLSYVAAHFGVRLLPEQACSADVQKIALLSDLHFPQSHPNITLSSVLSGVPEKNEKRLQKPLSEKCGSGVRGCGQDSDQGKQSPTQGTDDKPVALEEGATPGSVGVRGKGRRHLPVQAPKRPLKHMPLGKAICFKTCPMYFGRAIGEKWLEKCVLLVQCTKVFFALKPVAQHCGHQIACDDF